MTDCSNEGNTLKVHIENFQSISEADLEFKQGINIIVGQSNSGKSAILRAIKGAILNPSGSQRYIKNGTKKFQVNLDYEGNSIEWSREGQSPVYTINGEQYQKVGNSNLMNILDKSGFVLDENKNLMNIEGELELLFPFDKSNAELFKLFEKNIFCISDSTAIVKLIKADEDETEKQKDNAEYELNRYKQKLQALEELESEVDLNHLIKQRDVIASQLKNQQILVLDIKKLNSIISLGRILTKAVPPVDVRKDIHLEYKLLEEDIKKLQNIKELGHLLQSTPKAVNSIVDISTYIDVRKDLELLTQVSNLSENLFNRTEEVDIHVDMYKYFNLREDINNLTSLTSQIAQIKTNIEKYQASMQQLLEEKAKFKVCPLCGRKLENE